MSQGGRVRVDAAWVHDRITSAVNEIVGDPRVLRAGGSAGRARSQGRVKEQVWACTCGLPGSTSNWLSRARCRVCGKYAPALAAPGSPSDQMKGVPPKRAKSQDQRGIRLASPSKWENGPPASLRGSESSASPERVPGGPARPGPGTNPAKSTGKGTGAVTRPWDLQFKAQSDRLIALEKSHAKAHAAAAKCSQVVEAFMAKLHSARQELLAAQEEEARKKGDLLAGRGELEAIRQKVAEPRQGDKVAKLVHVLGTLGGSSLSWEQSCALEELQRLVAPGDDAATAPAEGNGVGEDPYADWLGMHDPPPGPVGVAPTDEAPNEDGGGSSQRREASGAAAAQTPPTPQGDGNLEGTPTPVPSPVRVEEPDTDMEDDGLEGTGRGTKRSQSVPGGGRGKIRGRSPARKPGSKIGVQVDSALKKSKKPKAGESLKASFAKVAMKGQGIEVPEGGSSQAAASSHRGEGVI